MSGRGEEDGGNAGELSMSFEETNKMRLSLGLKPLKMEAEELRGPSKEQVAAKEEGERAAKAAELAARVKQTRERRQQQEALDREKKLSAAGADVDDVMAWVSKSRLTEAQRKTDATAARRKTAQNARRRAAQEEDEDEEEEDEEMPSAAELAGAKVKHNAEDLEDGETMILTLEDRGILDDKGNLVEDDQDMVLENILAREDKQRSKAFKASAKQAKPLWEEDGKRRGLLDKYDEEEEQMMRIDDAGAVEAARQKRQDDIRARLAAGAAGGGGGGGGGGTVAQDASEAVQQQAADYYTQEEMAKFQKPKKKKERKLKKKALTAEELEALEAEAAARGTSDLGSRATRQRRADGKEATATAAAAERRARYEHALNKANYASLALRPDSAAGEDDGAAQEDDDLYQSLNKARLRAQKSAAAEPAANGPESLAADLIKRREEQQRAATAARSAAPVADTGLVFTDVAEFTRTIHVKEEEEEDSAGAAAPSAKQQQRQQQEQAGTVSVKKEEGEENYGLGEAMDTDQPAAAAAAAGDNVWAGWQPASATGGESSAAEMKQKLRARQQQEGQANARDGLEERLKQEAQEDTDNVTREKAIGSGLAGALAFLKDRGDLEAPVEWSGRTNDSKKVNIQGLDDVYTGGRQEDRLAQGVEMALTRKDEYGRILTPKEAFRQLCYRFHGIQPSKNSREKRQKKAAEEVAKKKLASDVGATSGSASLAHMKQVQKQAATPYVVLSGTIKPGQSRDATSGYATVDRAEQLTAAPPVLSKLPGGNTPLLGNAKPPSQGATRQKCAEAPRAPAGRTHASSRRTHLLSIAGVAWAPGALLDSLKGEASLWGQEAELYRRKAAEALSEATGTQQRVAAAAADPIRLDLLLAEVLLAAPLAALKQPASFSPAGVSAAEPVVLPSLNRERYESDYAALLAQELPYFKKAAACGHCGTVSGPAALQDRRWFDFLSYIQFKALGRQLASIVAPTGAATSTLSGMERMHAGSPEMQLKAAEQAWLATGQLPGAAGGYAGTPQQQLEAAAAAFKARGQAAEGSSGSAAAAAARLSPADVLRLAVGAEVLRHIESDLAAAAAQDGGDAGKAATVQLLAIRSTSTDLDAVRDGAQALLAYFVSRGFLASTAVAFFGASKNEERNHYTWSLGEPAFLKYWLQAPATLRSTAALDAEQGFSQDYVAGTLQAYFRRCGVAAGALKRYPSYSEEDLVAEQWTLRRVEPLPPGHDWQEYKEWQPDFCPLADDACY
ncbi:SART-1 family protein DOT2 [Chlorella vulgaris]